jgi:hypothetical protein
MVRRHVSLPKELVEFYEQSDISLSKFVQRKLREEKKKRGRKRKG